ncbi:MAG: O-antigen ligase family protein [Gammaproteobacteria bacterium]|nr:O-antigen ligase family protein [Gammaproteobacteria bacterium]
MNTTVKEVEYKNRFDFLLGLLVAVPIKYPDEPFYWFAFLVMFLAVTRIVLVRDNVIYLYAIILLSLLSLFSNFYSPFRSSINYSSAIASAVVFYLFLFRYCIRDCYGLLSGFVFVGKAYAVFVIILFFLLRPFDNFGNFFVNSDARMWAIGYFPEWPNVFCVFLVLSFFICLSRGNNFWAFICILSALLTTSRMAVLGFGLFLIFYFFKSKLRSKVIISLFFSFIALLSVFYLSDNEFVLDYLAHRFFKTDDREIIFDTLYVTFVSNPFGIGNVPFDVLNSTFVSYHSSFLKIAVRYGVFSLLIFVFLLYPRNVHKKFLSYNNLPIIFLILVGVVQDMLLHLHFILLYSIFLSYRESKLND